MACWNEMNFYGTPVKGFIISGQSPWGVFYEKEPNYLIR